MSYIAVLGWSFSVMLTLRGFSGLQLVRMLPVCSKTDYFNLNSSICAGSGYSIVMATNIFEFMEIVEGGPYIRSDCY